MSWSRAESVSSSGGRLAVRRVFVSEICSTHAGAPPSPSPSVSTMVGVACRVPAGARAANADGVSSRSGTCTAAWKYEVSAGCPGSGVVRDFLRVPLEGVEGEARLVELPGGRPRLRLGSGVEGGAGLRTSSSWGKVVVDEG